MESIGSKGSCSEDEPLVPDDFDDEFFKNVKEKVPLITKVLRQKDTQDSADNVQRLVIISNRYKSDLQIERTHNEESTVEIERLNERLEQGANLTRLDQETIAKLRTVIESAWKQKDAAQLREQIAQDELLHLREKVEQLEESVNRLSDKRQILQSRRDEQKEHEKLKNEVKELNKRLQIQKSYTSEIETMSKTLEEKNRELLKMLDETHSEAYNCKKRNDVLQKELNSLKVEQMKSSEQFTQLKTHTDHLTKVKVRQNLQILSLKTNLQHLNTQYNANCNKMAKLTVELEYAIQDRDRNKRDLVQRCNLLKLREDEIIKLRQENVKLCKAQENAVRKCCAIEESKRELEQEVNRMKTQFSTSDKEVEAMHRVIEQTQNEKENVTKDRDQLRRELLQERKLREQSENLYHEAQFDIKKLKDSINQMEVRFTKTMEDLKKAKKEKTKLVEEGQTLLDKLDTMQNELDSKANHEKELNRMITELQLKCVKLQTQYDVVNNEKAALQRNIHTLEDDKSKLKEQIMNVQETFETFKEKISYRDGEISKLQLQLDRLEKERRMLKSNMHTTQLGQQHAKAELLEKKKEADMFTRSLQEDEHKLSRMKMDYDKLLNEKNAINAALTSQNEQLMKLKNDHVNLQNAYDKKCNSIRECKKKIRGLSITVNKLSTACDILRKDKEASVDLRQELLQMHRKLNQERIKAKALMDEMLTPMNVHRWRNLGGTDQERMTLIRQNQALKKQILQQSVEAIEQDRVLSETQQLYLSLKEFLAKLPSHTIRGELNNIKSKLVNKDQKVRALTAELRTRDADERANSLKLEEMKISLATTKQQLNEEKKCKQKLWEEHQLLAQMQAQCFSAPPNIQRVLGGGFKMTMNY